MGGVRKVRTEGDGLGFLVAAGQLEWNGTTSVLAFTKFSSPAPVTDDMSAYRLGAGRYQVNIANFRGPTGIVIPVVSAGSSQTGVVGGAGGPIGLVPLSAAVVAGSYITGTNTYGFVIGICSASTFTDADVTFQAFAF